MQTHSGRPDQQRYLKLIPVPEAMRRLSASLAGYACPSERIPVDRSLGRVLAEDVMSRVEIPPRSLSAMDGYAVRLSDIKGASTSRPIRLVVKGILYPSDLNARGRSTRRRIGRSQTYQVGTGAPVPSGSEAVVRVEEAKLVSPRVIEVYREYPAGKNISTSGEDIKRGEKVLQKGDLISPADVALLIAVGVRRVRVLRRAVVGILSIGNELTEFDAREKTRATARTYNNYANLVQGYLNELGAETRLLGVCKDDRISITRSIEKAVVDGVDAIFTIGGSSVGRSDFTPDALVSVEGAEAVFHGLRVVPIRPAGMVLVRRGPERKPVVILPGNGVSVALTFFVVGLPVLNLISGIDAGARTCAIRASAVNEFENDRAIDALVLVRLLSSSDDGGGYEFEALTWGSNLMSSLSKANGFIHVKAHAKVAKSDEAVVQLLGSSELLRVSAGRQTP